MTSSNNEHASSHYKEEGSLEKLQVYTWGWKCKRYLEHPVILKSKGAFKDHFIWSCPKDSEANMKRLLMTKNGTIC